MKRIAALALVAALVLSISVATPERAEAIPVFDAAAFVQAVIDHAKRLFEIVQRGIQIANQVLELEYWFNKALRLESIPYREELLEFLELQAELLRQFDEVKGQYQGLSHSLEDVTREFDLTFPGWRALSDLAAETAGEIIRIESEGGSYTFETPAEVERYQAARSLQSVRQALALAGSHQSNIFESQAHMRGLKEAAAVVVGEQQILELQTSFQAVAAEQLIALREAVAALGGATATLGARELSAEMQQLAEQQASAEHLAELLRERYGAAVPEHTGEAGVSPFPSWVLP